MPFRTELMLTFPAPCHSIILQNRADAYFPCSMPFYYLAEQSWCWACLPGVSLAPSSHRVSHQKIITAHKKGNKKPKQIWGWPSYDATSRYWLLVIPASSLFQSFWVISIQNKKCVRTLYYLHDIESPRNAYYSITLLIWLKGTVPQDFQLQIFFMNQFPPSPWVYH